jgi:PAS domain-containing protein
VFISSAFISSLSLVLFVDIYCLFLQGDNNNHLTSIDLDDLFNDMYYDLEPNPVTSSTTSPPPPSGAGAVKTVVVPSASPATEEDIRKRKMDAAGIKQQQQQHGAAAADLGGGGGSGMSVGSGDDGGYGGDDAAGSSKELTEEQRIERRERNREHAKRSRLRKKFLLESLQEQIHGLEEQIDGLKSALKQEVPQKADELIAKICGDKEKYTPLPMPSGFGPVKTIMEPDFRLMSALSGSQQNFAISDPTLPDNPIVYVSQGFLDLTGYTLDQVLGRNCRFLQGPGTDQSAVEVIRRGIAEGVDTSVCLLNYKVRTQRYVELFGELSLLSLFSLSLLRRPGLFVCCCCGNTGRRHPLLEPVLRGGLAGRRGEHCQLRRGAVRGEPGRRREARQVRGGRQQEAQGRGIVNNMWRTKRQWLGRSRRRRRRQEQQQH